MSDNFQHVSEVTPGILTQKHIRGDYAIIKIGLASERPSEGNQQLIFWFSTDTFTMSYWDKTTEAWKSAAAFS